MKFVIREMNRGDIQKVQHVAKRSWNSTYEGIIPLEIQERFLKSAYNEEIMQKRMDRSIIYVSELEGEIVGFANFLPVKNDGKAELIAIYLDPKHQGKGMGTALLAEGIKNLSSAKEIFVNVEKENKIGKTFYQARGFKVVSEFDEDFDGHALKTVRMVLKVEESNGCQS